MPGMFVSMVWATLMSPFSISSPHSAIAPNDEMNPSCGMTQSMGSVSSALVLLLTIVTRPMRLEPAISFSSQNVRSCFLPAADNASTRSIEKGDIKVAQTMETNIPGIYAAGDITTYPGKLKLIATGVAEACIAVNHAVHFINPSAKIEPGHSSNMALFGQKDD